jgi:type II secretory pathway pseudopilin PulG
MRVEKAAHRKAFTLVELMIIVVLLSILTALSIPRYVNARERAEEAAEVKIVKSVRTAIEAYRAGQIMHGGGAVFPEKLDDAPTESDAGPTNPFFVHIMDIPLTSGWEKGSTIHTYVSPSGNEFVYRPETGQFQ